MKKIKWEPVSILLVIVFTLGAVIVSLLYQNLSTKNKIELLARAPEKGNWFPRIIRVKQGEVMIYLRNVDTVSHGFYLPAFHIMEPEIKAGYVKEIKFSADRKGRFPFYCVVWCGDYHMQMRGTLIVE